MAASKGVWLDTDTGSIVNSEPERGRLIVAPGAEVDDNAQAVIDLYADNAKTVADEVPQAKPATKSAAKKS